MRASKFSESQIVSILREVELGASVVETCRKHGIGDSTYYKWKQSYGGLDMNQLKRMKELEAENMRLKKMYSELSLLHHAMEEVVLKKR